MTISDNILSPLGEFKARIEDAPTCRIISEHDDGVFEILDITGPKMNKGALFTVRRIGSYEPSEEHPCQMYEQTVDYHPDEREVKYLRLERENEG